MMRRNRHRTPYGIYLLPTVLNLYCVMGEILIIGTGLQFLSHENGIIPDERGKVNATPAHKHGSLEGD